MTDPFPLPNERYPWAIGHLGTLESKVMFLAEIPSKSGLERARKNPELQSPENQWNVSWPDKFFRTQLADVGFKKNGPFSEGGWGCYITNVVRGFGDVAKVWEGRPEKERFHYAELSADLLQKEISTMAPKLVVVMGDRAQATFWYLMSKGLVQVDPKTVRPLDHYSKFRNKNFPSRKAHDAYHADMIALKAEADSL